MRGARQGGCTHHVRPLPSSCPSSLLASDTFTFHYTQRVRNSTVSLLLCCGHNLFAFVGQASVRVCVCVCARAHTHTHTHTHTRTHHSHAKVSLTRSLARAHACTLRHSYAVHDEAKEKDFHLFMSWVGAPTGGRHEMVPEAIFNEAERLAKAALEDDDDDDDDDDKDGMAE